MIFLAKENQHEQRKHIGQYHYQVLITAGHLQDFDEFIAAGTGEAEQQARAKGRKNLPVTED